MKELLKLRITVPRCGYSGCGKLDGPPIMRGGISQSACCGRLWL